MRHIVRVWNRFGRQAAFGVVLGSGLLVSACGMLHRMPGEMQRPAAEEFGFAPRASAVGLYRASITPDEPIRVGRMQTLRLQVQDATGQPLDGATIAVDGAMPQHGHGLPTKPRVTRNHRGGLYDVEGMRFNMGGWWVVKFRIESTAGTDSVVFNLDLRGGS
jgi:hypothetical protein